MSVETSPTLVPAGDEPEPGPVGPVRRQLFWIVPLALATIGLSVYLLLHHRWGADVAAILTLPVEVVGLVVGILIERGSTRIPTLRVPRGRRRVWRWAATAAALVLAGTATVWWFQREPDPRDFLSGVIRIGYTNEYAGWHATGGRPAHGMDVDVAYALARDFGFTIKWVPLGRLTNRMAALNGSWVDDQGQTESAVQLVISNFSMTPAKAETIDFAGPYFVDSQGYLSATPAHDISELPTTGRVCVLAGSTSSDALYQRGWSTLEKPSLDTCLSAFTQGTVQAVSGDRTTLAGFAWALGKDPATYIAFANGSEEYGIGLPNNRPRLCAAVSTTLDKFLTNEWERSFKENLKPIGLVPADVVKPGHTDTCQRPGPWNQD
ncbi:transporter substrate-binding domain-containing protein [Dactylosporangium sp. NPDC051541]|uniref:transporter substrate-binding domain-containing protein n=1 Tax=Dactylosporangium sp. NPDC051541 TaxID=3363977 RepID=UPI0037B63383